MKIWHLYPTISAPMPFQMALDEIIFRQLEHQEDKAGANPVFRFFFSSEPWVSVGYTYRKSAAQGQGPVSAEVPVCRRLTGGGRVSHGKDLMFSLASHKTLDDSFKSVRLSYLKIHEAVKSAWDNLGRQSRFYRCDENLPRGLDCFQYPIATDLEAGGKKVAGGSQKRSRGTFLHEESLQLLQGVRHDDLMREILKAFETKFGIRFLKQDIHPDLMKQVKRLAAEKYSVNPDLSADPAEQMKVTA